MGEVEKDGKYRARYERNGIVESPKEEWQLVEQIKVYNLGAGVGVYIPKHITRYLGLNSNHRIDIAFKKSQITTHEERPDQELTPPKLSGLNVRSYGTQRFLDLFLESDMQEAELKPSYGATHSFLKRHPEYGKKIRVRLTKKGKPEQYCWVEKREIARARER